MSSETQSDRELIQRVVLRDEAAFEILYRRCYSSVRGRIYGMVREHNATEDLTQEVFLRIWDRSEQWSGHGPFLAWALRIAVRLTLNHLRTVRRRREQPLAACQPDGETQQTPVGSPLHGVSVSDPETAYEELEWRDRLSRALEPLSDDQRTLFELVHDSQLSIADAARRLGIPEGTARSRLFYARRQIARRWKMDEED